MGAFSWAHLDFRGFASDRKDAKTTRKLHTKPNSVMVTFGEIVRKLNHGVPKHVERGPTRLKLMMITPLRSTPTFGYRRPKQIKKNRENQKTNMTAKVA